MLSLSVVTKQIWGLTVVNTVDLAIENDEIDGFVGPNDAGKTTLLNIISGISSPTAEKIILYGDDVPDWKTDRVSVKELQKHSRLQIISQT